MEESASDSTSVTNCFRFEQKLFTYQFYNISLNSKSTVPLSFLNFFFKIKNKFLKVLKYKKKKKIAEYCTTIGIDFFELIY